MREFVLVDIQIKSKEKLVEQYLDGVLKELAFHSKENQSERESIVYSSVLIPKLEEDLNDFLYTRIKPALLLQTVKIMGQEIPGDYLYSLFNVIKENIFKMSFQFITTVSSDMMNVFYTDGSFKKATNEASFSCCQLLNEGTEIDCMNDTFTNEDKQYLSYAGKIADGTNNVGELTGIKTAVEKFGDRLYQVIISDSEYSIKSYREWIYNWRKNGYKTYAKKPILNQELIKETDRILSESKKIVLFKWTKGHANNLFNEKCDELAKQELGI